MAALKNLKGIRATKRGHDVVVGLMGNVKDEKVIARALSLAYKPQINTTISGHINTALDGVKAVTKRGRVNARVATAAIRTPIGSQPGFKRERIDLKLSPQWTPLTEPYLARKARQGSPAKFRFWSNTGNLGRAVAAIPNVRATSKLKFRKPNKTFGKGPNKYEYEVSTHLTNLPAPLQDLIRRPFMQAMAGEDSSVSKVSEATGDLALIAFLEVYGSSKSKRNKRPFIAQLSRTLGKRAADRIANFEPYERT